MSDDATEAMAANLAAACDHCGGGVAEFKASAWKSGEGVRYFCHNDSRSCYNDRRGRYFE